MAGAAKASGMDDGPEPVAAAVAPKKGKGGLILMVVTVLLSAGISSGAAWWFAGRNAAHAPEGEDAEAAEAEKAKPKAPPQYLPLEPAFTVNLEDPEMSRFLQVEMQVMAREADALAAVQQHAPRIRNALLLLLGQQRVADLGTREGKEKLQAAVLAEIQKILTEETGKPGVEAVYFTSFVMQ
jgi:flagellar FliL protein